MNFRPKLSLKARRRTRTQETTPPGSGRPDSEPRGFHNRNRSRESTAGGFGSHSPMGRNRRGNRADLDNLGIHSPEDRSRRGILSSLGTHSPAARSRDIRSRDIRRLGSRNRCRVAEVVYLRLLQKSRLHLQSLLRGRLPARHPPLLQWQHQKPLPIFPHRGRVERDHTGWCRPRDSRPTRQSDRAQFGSLSLRPSTGSNRQRQRIQRTLSLD
jgi:hypothetical protein